MIVPFSVHPLASLPALRPSSCLSHAPSSYHPSHGHASPHQQRVLLLSVSVALQSSISQLSPKENSIQQI